MQTDILDTVIDTLPSSWQLEHLLDQCASVVYSVDPALSTAIRDRIHSLSLTFGDIGCIETVHSALPANPSFRQVADVVFCAFPTLKHEIRVFLTRADQTMGRRKFRELLRESERRPDLSATP
jgi:hypothetical protein